MPDASPALGMEREALVEVSAAAAARDEAALARALRLAHRFAVPAAVDEVLLQAHLFIGYPLAMEALRLWREVNPTAPAPASLGGDEDWSARGEEVCRTVYGDNYEKLRANVGALHPDLERWMVEGGYGRVIGRPGVDLATRELCIAALLAVWGAPRQLHSHLRGASNAGASEAEVDAAVEIACRYLDPAPAQEVRELWRRVRAPAPVRSR